MDEPSMSGALHPEVSCQEQIRRSGERPDQEAEDVSVNEHLGMAEKSYAADQRSNTDTSITAGPFSKGVRETHPTREDPDADVSHAPEHKLRSQPLGEATLPPAQRQTVLSAADESSRERFATENKPNSENSMSSELDGLPTDDGPSSDLEMTQALARRSVEVNYNTRSTWQRWREESLPWSPDNLSGKLPHPPDPSIPHDEGDPFPTPYWDARKHSSGRVYFVDHQTSFPTWSDPRIPMKQLPNGVAIHAKKYGLLEFTYTRLGVTKSSCEFASETPLSQIVRRFEEFEATATQMLDALGAPHILEAWQTNLLSRNLMVINQVHIPKVWALVHEDVNSLGLLITHISRTDKSLAKLLWERLSDFRRVWGPLPQRTIKAQNWDATCTWEQDIGSSDLHAFLKFLDKHKPPYSLPLKTDCRFTFITGLYRPRLLVLFSPPSEDLIHKKRTENMPLGAKTWRGGLPDVKMPICMNAPGMLQLSIFNACSNLLHELSRTYDLAAEISVDDNLNSVIDSRMLWVVVRFAWETHIEHLRNEIEEAERSSLAKPNVGSLRQINIQRRLIQQAAKDIKGCLKALGFVSKPRILDEFRDSFNILEEKASALKQDVNDTTTLIIGAISVMDAGDSKIQARRATALTALAAIYLPLSLATGVFGMNIWEINEGAPTWSAPVSLGLGLLALSLPFLAWVFIDSLKRAWIKIRRRDHVDKSHDTSRVERGIVGSSKSRQRSGKKKRF